MPKPKLHVVTNLPAKTALPHDLVVGLQGIKVLIDLFDGLAERGHVGIVEGVLLVGLREQWAKVAQAAGWER
ncbi:MAG: hypothetical protein U1E23_09460 [Reyranellaceae bacterium]